MRLSLHFTREELEFSSTALRLGIENKIPEEQLSVWQQGCELILEPIRLVLAAKIHVDSGYRCPELNTLKGGAVNSQHTRMGSCAFDLQCFQFGNRKLFDVAVQFLQTAPIDQLIYEFGNDEQPAWVHLSYTVDQVPRRMVLRSCKEEQKTVYQIYNFQS